jgi:hypothetical protein
MKKLTKRMLIVFVLLTGIVQAKNLSVWLLGGNDLTARIGYKATDKTEVGVEGVWIQDCAGDAGLYGSYQLGTVEIPNPIPVAGLPDKLSGTAYIGFHGGIDLIDNGTYSGPIAGFDLNGFIVEYQRLRANYKMIAADNEQKVVFGFCWRF